MAGLGAGAAFTLTADIVLASVPKKKAGAASGVADTAYELGTALGIALLGSVINGVYRSGIGAPAGVAEPALASARDSLGAAHAVAGTLPPDAGAALLRAAQQSLRARPRRRIGVRRAAAVRRGGRRLAGAPRPRPPAQAAHHSAAGWLY